ncbi:hypothetical protein HCN44_001166 [Aphidius gifuensis]|uniref:H15 domain-containing protein n=1 Tax=Aphidius gifuensis TaxID=684658 RepID=A0A835CNX8_APHGI|nr:uncharacterized protein LOC122856893 [Aphidius gifuensis]KAF7988593.1 hypothetical protein HCN44_001166 [Aphidius gifuensis]
MGSSKTSKFGKMVVKAIKRLQEAQGSSPKEISNYVSQEYNVPSEEIKKQINVALKQGVEYGILLKRTGGVYTCNPEIINIPTLADGQAKTSCSHGMKMSKRFGRRSRSKSRGRTSRRRGKSSSRSKRRGSRRRRRRH